MLFNVLLAGDLHADKEKEATLAYQDCYDCVQNIIRTFPFLLHSITL